MDHQNNRPGCFLGFRHTRLGRLRSCPVSQNINTRTLEQLLNRINKTGITQLPVYADETFAGVLTRRGILKWLSSVGLNHGTDCSGLRSVLVGVLLLSEEHPENHRFIPRNTPLMKMGEMIDHQPRLETLLITQNGKPTEKLLGIANRLDIHAAI